MERLYKNNLLIKIIAVITMVIDHVGGIFFPHLLILRIVGRLSFPLFAYLVSEGFDKTRNKQSYLLRIFCFFIISQIPYSLAFHDGQLNIFMTLLFGLIIILIFENNILDTFKKVSLTIFLFFIGFILPLDYGIAGIISILIFHTFKHSYRKLFILQTMLWLGYIIMLFINAQLGPKSFNYPTDAIQILAPFSILIIWIIHHFYSTKEHWQVSKLSKYITQYGFYIFYPAHLLLLYWVGILVK